jgi:hypothetical protein
VARFDDGAAAWLALPAGPGAVFLMASGWHAEESQLALSTKFVPVLHAILEASAGLAGGQAQVFVGDPVPLPPADGRARSIRRPDGRVVPLAADAEVFGETDVPGLYALEGDGAPRTFAVNVPPAESATAPLPPEALERLGAGEAAGGAARKEAAAAPAAAHRARLESEQKGWRWLLAAALAALVAESWIAARLGRRRPRSQEVAS